MKYLKIFRISTIHILAASLSCSCLIASEVPKAKNVILMIGDGMGFNCDIAGTCYRHGEMSGQTYHSFPIAIACTTFSLIKQEGPFPDILKGYSSELFWETFSGANLGTQFTRTTDSSAASTAIHGGSKTYNRYVGMGVDQKPIELISELAVKTGRRAGCVTTVTLSNATPAGFAAHNLDRGKADLLFRQMAAKDSPLSVIVGGGHPMYDKGIALKTNDENEATRKKRFFNVDGENTWRQISSGSLNGFTFVETRADFEAIAERRKAPPEKMLGIFRSLSYLPPVDGNLENMPKTEEVFRRQYENVNENELPTLSTLAIASLNVLNQDNKTGFIVMIEGGAIDGANHKHNVEQSVLEHTGFTKAIDKVIDWIEKNSSWQETLLIITADHETGQIWGPNSYIDDNENGVFDEGDSFNDFKPVKNNGRGRIPDTQYGSHGHTNALVPLWAKGQGEKLFLKYVRGNDRRAGDFWNFNGQYIDNIDIFRVMKDIIE